MKALKQQIGLVGLLIILVTVTPAFAIDAQNRNMFLVCAMCIAPVLLFFYKSRATWIEFVLIMLGMLMVSIPLMVNPDSFRASTVIYSWLFFLYFIVFTRVLLGSDYSKERFLNLLKYLLYAYTITLIIQQLCVLLGLPIFNEAAYNPLEPWKLNSLAPEPSHTARIISLILLLYVKGFVSLVGTTSLKQTYKLIDKSVLICYLYCIITMGSGTGFVFLALVILDFLPKRNILSFGILAALVLSLIYYVFKDVPAFERSFNFISMLIHYNEDELISGDLSAAIRIVPTVHGFQAIDFFSLEGIFGHGIDADGGLTPLPSVDCGAGSFAITYNYGLLISIIFWVFSYKICSLKGDTIMSAIIWLLLVFFYGGINNPILWMTLILIFTFKQLFYSNYGNRSEENYMGRLR